MINSDGNDFRGIHRDVNRCGAGQQTNYHDLPGLAQVYILFCKSQGFQDQDIVLYCLLRLRITGDHIPLQHVGDDVSQKTVFRQGDQVAKNLRPLRERVSLYFDKISYRKHKPEDTHDEEN